LDSAIAAGEDNGCCVPHIITTNIEHVAIELPLKRWQEQGRISMQPLFYTDLSIHYSAFLNV
jgi:hypothetical protein